MRYNVAQLLKEHIGSTRTYKLEETFTGSQQIADSACGQVNLMRTHHGVLITGEVEIQVPLTCDRCLETFARTSRIGIEE